VFIKITANLKGECNSSIFSAGTSTLRYEIDNSIKYETLNALIFNLKKKNMRKITFKLKVVLKYFL